jgi:hypothetical protein
MARAFLPAAPAVMPALTWRRTATAPKKNVEMNLDTAGVDARATAISEV